MFGRKSSKDGTGPREPRLAERQANEGADADVSKTPPLERETTDKLADTDGPPPFGAIKPTGAAPIATTPAPVAVPTPPAQPSPPSSPASGSERPHDPPKKPADFITPIARRVDLKAPGQAEAEGKKLVVGRDITLSGEIKACEKLVVEGRVDANLSECKTLLVAAGGLFSGSATVDRCEVRGHFEGRLVVRGHLHVYSGGVAKGQLSYQDVEVEKGGRISGELSYVRGQGAGGDASRVTAPRDAMPSPGPHPISAPQRSVQSPLPSSTDKSTISTGPRTSEQRVSVIAPDAEDPKPLDLGLGFDDDPPSEAQ